MKTQVENKDVPAQTEKDKTPIATTTAVPRTILSELKFQLLLLDKAVGQKDIRQIQKLSQGVRRFKKVIKGHHLLKVFQTVLPQIQQNFDKSQDFDATFNEELDLPKQIIPKMSKSFEIELFLQTLHLAWLVQQRQIETAQHLAQLLISKCIEANKRYNDTLLSICYFYLSRSYELADNLEAIREILLQGYRNAVLNHDENNQGVILNLLLRNFLHYNEYEQAYNFIDKISMPECNANDLVRFLYYTGRIKAVRGEYTVNNRIINYQKDALSRLNQALRKAPDHTAHYFKIEVQKWACLVELLQGEIPNRDTFAQSSFQKALYPYYMIVSTVIKGDLNQFSQVVRQYQSVYLRDKLYNIVQRLQQIVIKTGLRRINLSYSRITLSDIQQKLNLPQNCDAELIVAKAIRDGTLNAIIDHENQFIITKEKNDIYGTLEPQEAFAKRIQFCINIHHQAVRALQYQNPSYEYLEQGNTDELTAEELLNLVDLAGDF